MSNQRESPLCIRAGVELLLPMVGARGVLAGWASTPRLGAFQTRRCCALFHAPHPRAPKTSVIQGRLADDAPVFANPSAGVVDGLGSGLGAGALGSGLGAGALGSGLGVDAGGSGVTLGVGAGVLGSGLGAGVLGSGLGVGAGGSGVTLGVGTGALGSGLGAGALGSGLGAGVLGSGLGVGAGGSGVTLGVGTGVLGSGLGAGALGSGLGVDAGGSGVTLGVGAGVLGSGVGAGGVGGTHCLMEGSHSMQPFPSHVSASIEEAACDVSPKRDSVQISPMIVASNATLSGIRFLGLVAIALPFSGRWLM